MKDKKIVLISGPKNVGRSTLATNLEHTFDFFRLNISEYLMDCIDLSNCSRNNEELKKQAMRLDNETEGKWILDAILREMHTNGKHYHIVVDAVRDMKQINHIRKRFSLRVVHVHLKISSKPNENRMDGYDNNAEEEDLEELCNDADLCIDTTLVDNQDILVRVASRLQLYASPASKFVDVVIGGQYGSEGKGQIAAYLAKNYDVLVRVGGPNAGHKVSSERGKYTYHHLPSGCPLW